ncbi:malonic semialdehyde reductase [Micromonospora sp. 4G57]|jgi:3-hydroxypropanoate dehydrogenase|uniref:Malonic semialdehyde reductase n=1 Tax=Micromonospora sicca TaxID=2202420 RepID=A0A317CZH8_9ACTN|nr:MULTISPECIES: malonic semialdehyde reductase [Micromonospora]MDZ5443706.1 malonic semialdehyde reductase [Micromonospora sp. 4G57]MDZ5488822.1 malonic semialdehyde reductase [Micromonospora sp. 4G53]PWR07807.1 malonic semialdehyde reductase [Micromonospora sp. 4G51]
MTDLITLHPEARAQLFTDARTANTFTDEPVSDEQLRAIFELAKYPPTAANTQPLRVLYIRDGEPRERLLTHMNEGNRAKTASAPVVAVLAADTDFHEFIPRVFPIRAQMRDALAGDVQARERMARFNATLQIGYWLLAVRAAGLAAGPMGGFDADGLDKEFFADNGWRSVLVVNIGKPGPDAWFPRLPRLDYDDVVRHA